MLSAENPAPDLPCARKFPQVNGSGSDEIERPSSPSSKLLPLLPLPAVVVDLPNPSQPLQADLGHRTNFSIRHHVFSARGKDIKKNWPFSLKALQLCFKYGVKDVLPPFQPLDTVKNNPSLNRCTVETSYLEKQQEGNHNKDPRPDSPVELDSSDNVQLNKKLAETCIDISTCRTAEEKDFTSTTTTDSQSEIQSIRDTDNRQPSTPLETEILSKASVESWVPPVTNKTEVISRPSGKKCRLIVKFGGNSDRTLTEDIASNCTTVSETMASKVCPVCKTFSSSSITTLNAHMDQCLSVESTPKWTADSKLTRHRIKPKKTRLMVDIYATAQPCSLEELARRNGASWATASSLPTLGTQTLGTSGERKRHGVPPIHPEAPGDVGPVYIDANGTKVRILSKSSDPAPASKVREDTGARKACRAGKGSKHISKKKKKRLAQKPHKYLKLAAQSKKIFSHNNKMAHGSQISGVGGENGEGKYCKKEHQMLKRSKPSDSGTLRPWVCSKQRGFTKKIVGNEGPQPMRCKWHLPQGLMVENFQCYLGDSLAEGNCVKKYTSLFSSGNDERMEMPFHKAQVSDKRDEFPGRKKAGNISVGAEMSDNFVISCPSTKRDANQLSKGIASTQGCQPSEKAVGTKEDATINSDISPTAHSKSSGNSHAIVTKSMKFSSCGENLMSASNQSTVTRSRPRKVKKWLALKKSRVPSSTERDEEILAWDSKVNHQYALMHSNNEDRIGREEMTENMCLERSTFLRTRQESEISISQSMNALALTNSKCTPHSYGHDGGLILHSVGRPGDDFEQKADFLQSAGKEVQVHVEGIVIDPSLKASDAKTATGLNTSLDKEFYQLSDSSKILDNSLQSVEDYRRLFCRMEAPTGPSGPDFVHNQEMFSADEVNNGVMEPSADMGLELGAEGGQGNSFPEVDPIPIPGPPGSFLPSPRDMRSEDFQGNSSLTTSRVQSSPDQRDMIDGDSSDSPISPASTISNSTDGRPTVRFFEPLSSIVSYADQDKIRSGLTATRIERFVNDGVAASQATSRGVERSPFDGHAPKVDRVAIEKGVLSFNSDRPCCCQRKERFSQGISLHNQDSQLLRRRRMSSVTLPATEKQLTCISDPMLTRPNMKPEFVPLSSWSTTGSEKGVPPVIKPPESSPSFKDHPSDEMRFLAHTDCGSASPSASNPILRLMGKNLMVVNKDEDASMLQRQLQPQTQNVQKTSQLPTPSAVCPGNNPKQDPFVFHHMIPHSSVISSQDSHSMEGQCSKVGLLSGFRSYSEWKLPQAPARLPAGMFRDQGSDGSFTTLEPYEYKVDHRFPGRECMLKSRPNAPSAYSMEKSKATPHSQHNPSVSSVPPVKEIIVTDDVHEGENFLTSDVLRYSEGWRESQVVSSAVSIPTVSSHSGNSFGPLSCYDSQDHAYLDSSPVMHNANIHATSTRLATARPNTWVCTLEGPGVLHRSPFGSAPSSASHLRPAALYYPPSYS
uniref:Uncharacterized protein n=1 Tax=Rhizophora mucronata TaxID=61149 RepID=A0A2P2KKY9_RHIMU